MATTAEMLHEARELAVAELPYLTKTVANRSMVGPPEMQIIDVHRLQALVAAIELIDRLQRQ